MLQLRLRMPKTDAVELNKFFIVCVRESSPDNFTDCGMKTKQK